MKRKQRSLLVNIIYLMRHRFCVVPQESFFKAVVFPFTHIHISLKISTPFRKLTINSKSYRPRTIEWVGFKTFYYPGYKLCEIKLALFNFILFMTMRID